MKEKNKSKEFSKTNKQFFKLFVTNVIIFILVYCLLGVALFEIIKGINISSIDKRINEGKDRINNVYQNEESNTPINFLLNDPRIMLILFDKDKEVIEGGYSTSILNYLIEKESFGPGEFYEKEEIDVALKNDLFILNDLDIYIRNNEISTSSKDFRYTCLSFEIVESNTEAKYCKVITIINSEIDNIKNITNVYLVTSLFVFIFGIIFSLILTNLSIKPLRKSIQTEIQFVNDASHELKTPLAIVQSKLENILTKTDEPVYNVSEDLAISLSQVTRLNRLTNDLLKLARSDNEVESYNFEEHDVSSIVKETSNIFFETAIFQEKQFDIELDDVKAFIDKDKFIELLIILFDNALKYTNTGDKIKVKLSKNINDLILEISDTGIGINDETKEKIFNRFYREDKSRSQLTGGNGLGMSIAKDIIDHHRGKIMVDHNEPKGTKFIIYISLKDKK